MLNIQLVVATSNIKIRKFNKLAIGQFMDGDIELHSFVGATGAENKYNELKQQSKNVWWMFCGDTDHAASVPVFKQWREHLSPERIIEYNKPAAVQEIESELPEFDIDTDTIGTVTFDAEEWRAIASRDKYSNETFASQSIWRKDTELDMWRYKPYSIYYMKIAGTNLYQFMKPEELKALGYDFDSLYQSQQA